MKIGNLLKSTTAYKIFNADKLNGTLSHAILIFCEDGYMLKDYLKEFAKQILCEKQNACGECRVCKLIDGDNYQDLIVYPKDKKVSTGDIDDLVAKTFTRPLEGDKKVFLITDGQNLNDKCQNKLLKTLEEPPKNTYFIIGTTSINSILPTVLSRVKKLEILPFNSEVIFEFLNSECQDKEKLKNAICLSNGKIGESLFRYSSCEGLEVEKKVKKILLEMQNSGQVLKYSSTIKKEEVKDFLSELSRILTTAIRHKSGITYESDQDIEKIAKEFTYGALVYALDVVRKYEKTVHFYGNLQAICDGVLFGILEGKYKCSK